MPFLVNYIYMPHMDLSNDIERVETTSMADVVETKLREYLKKKALKPGSPLPKEMELAEALGVSRNVVREALSRLRMLGMIDSRKKRGMVLVEPDVLKAFERVLDPVILDNQTLQDLFELRLVLEMGLADILYRRMTDKDLNELETIVDKEKGRQSASFKLKHEIAFHGKLYQMTGNTTFLRFQSMLLPVFEYVVDLRKKDGIVSGKTTHRDLLELLKHGTAEDFRRGMKDHLKPHFERVNR